MNKTRFGWRTVFSCFAIFIAAIVLPIACRSPEDECGKSEYIIQEAADCLAYPQAASAKERLWRSYGSKETCNDFIDQAAKYSLTKPELIAAARWTQVHKSNLRQFWLQERGQDFCDWNGRKL